MPFVRKGTIVSAALFCGLLYSHPAYAQDSGDRTVEQYSCKDVMRETGPNRDIAIAFIHGVFLGKSGMNKFNIEVLRKQADTFVDACLDNPNNKAFDVMHKIKG